MLSDTQQGTSLLLSRTDCALLRALLIEHVKKADRLTLEMRNADLRRQWGHERDRAMRLLNRIPVPDAQ